MRIGRILMGLAAVVSICGCALQDDIYSLDHRLAALERHNVELARQNSELQQRNQELIQSRDTITTRVEGLDQTRRSDEMELRGQYAEMAAQLQALREQAQLLTGRMDEMDYLLNQKLKKFEDAQEKNDERMDRIATDVAAVQKRLESLSSAPRPAAPPAVKPVPVPPSTGNAAGPAMSDQELYQSTKKTFDAGNLEAARSGFEKLVADYPKSQLADNAQYFIGETYYREKWYEKAILEYQKVIENYPAGNKVAAALLKQGLSFLNIGESNNARLIFKDLIARYPGTEEAETAKQKLQSP